MRTRRICLTVKSYLIGVISFILLTLNRHDNVFFPFHKNFLVDRFLFKFFSINCVVVAAVIDIVVVLECQNCFKQHPSYFLSISNMSSKLVTIKLNQCYELTFTLIIRPGLVTKQASESK